MDIKPDSWYPIAAAAKISGIPKRTLQKHAKDNDLRRIGNRYMYYGFELTELIELKEKIETKPAQSAERATQKKVGANSFTIPKIQDFKLDDIEKQEFKFKRPGQFPKEGNFVFVPKDLVYAEYTEWEYKDAEDKLKEWQYQKQLLLDQQKTFDNLIKTQKEQTLFYKDQVKYYQKLADRTLSMHEKLLETIQTQTKDHFIDTTIRAKKTDWSKKDKK
jgi:hypothetical protein|tara:strand:+ start:105 stop:758 length:654 start_codon:yes stop_codon:yes gene_type:complete